MQEKAIKMIEEMKEKYNIPHDQKSVFWNDIINIIWAYSDWLKQACFEETPAEQVDRENFIPLH